MSLTLAIGAAGKTAGLVVPALISSGAAVRGLVRREADLGAVRRFGAEAVVGDLADLPSIQRALHGVTSVFYLAPAFMPHEAEIGCRVVAAAVSAGVRRFVFSSVIHPVLSHLTNHAAKAVVEEAILDTSLEYTFLHPALFFQNFAGSWPSVAQNGVLAEPWSAETRFSRVDYRDVAEAAAIALTSDRLLNGTFELCADGGLNRHEVAAIISEVLGREIKAGTLDPNSLGEAAAPMRPMFAHYDRTGLTGNPLTLRALLNREPLSLRAYFHQLAETT